MKKILLLGVMSMIVFSCADNSVEPLAPPPAQPDTEEPDQVEVRVTLSALPVHHTKVGMTEDADGAFSPAFSQDDLLVINENSYTLVSFEENAAVFKGPRLQKGPYDISLGNLDHSMSQKGNADFSHLSYAVSLSGVDEYEKISFDYDWAAAHGGSLVRPTVLKLDMSFVEQTSALAYVSVSGGSLENKVTLNIIDGKLASEQKYVAYVPLDGKVVFDEGDSITIEAADVSGNIFTAAYEPGLQEFPKGYVSVLPVITASWKSELTGPGSEYDPFIIRTAEDFKNISSLLSDGAVTYFTLEEDIDLSQYSNWTPLNQKSTPMNLVLDGKNHKITGLCCHASAYPSCFGIIAGEVKNLEFVNPVIESSADSPCGVVCSVSAASGETHELVLENVTVKGGAVRSASATNSLGGFVGEAYNTIFRNCTYDGTVERTNAEAALNAYYPVGGLVGKMMDNVVLENCITSGSLVTASGRACGGFVGLCSLYISITGCRSSMDITAKHDLAGGIIGYAGSGELTECSYEGDIKVIDKGAGQSYVGGIVGYASKNIVVTNCRFAGCISTPSNIVGGIVGQCSNENQSGTVISGCTSSGKIDSEGSYVGGIVGRPLDSTMKVENCSSSCEINATGNYIGGIAGSFSNGIVSRCFTTGNISISGNSAGGIVGSLSKGTVSNCYATGNISALTNDSKVGGLVGNNTTGTVEYSYATGNISGLRAQVGGLIGLANTSPTVNKCIAWNSSISVTGNAAGRYSCAAVVGTMFPLGIATDCVRIPGLTVSGLYEETDPTSAIYHMNGVFDQDNVTADAPLKNNIGVSVTNKKIESPNKFPYHGKAAGSSETLSAVATRLGWDVAVWDLSGNEPKLK